jgi:hypothetical protein
MHTVEIEPMSAPASPAQDTTAAPGAVGAAALWHPDAEAWDAPFRAWAEHVTTQTAAFGGMVALLVAEWIGAAWRLRRANTDVALDRSLTNRQWATVEREARRSLWRAGVDLKRWTRLLTEELQRRARRGDRGAEGQMAALLSLPAPPPFPPARWIDLNDDPAPESDASPDQATETEPPIRAADQSTSSYNLSPTPWDGWAQAEAVPVIAPGAVEAGRLAVARGSPGTESPGT